MDHSSLLKPDPRVGMKRRRAAVAANCPVCASCGAELSARKRPIVQLCDECGDRLADDGVSWFVAHLDRSVVPGSVFRGNIGDVGFGGKRLYVTRANPSFERPPRNILVELSFLLQQNLWSRSPAQATCKSSRRRPRHSVRLLSARSRPTRRSRRLEPGSATPTRCSSSPVPAACAHFQTRVSERLSSIRSLSLSREETNVRARRSVFTSQRNADTNADRRRHVERLRTARLSRQRRMARAPRAILGGR